MKKLIAELVILGIQIGAIFFMGYAIGSGNGAAKLAKETIIKQNRRNDECLADLAIMKIRLSSQAQTIASLLAKSNDSPARPVGLHR